MKCKRLVLNKITIVNLNMEQMKSVKGGFDLEDYSPDPTKSDNNDDSENNC